MMSMKPLAYVAGPITGNPWGCVKQATDAFTHLRSIGVVPFLPQLSVLHEMVASMHYEEWLVYDTDVLDRCDLLVRLEGESKGADHEVEHANTIGIPVVCWQESNISESLNRVIVAMRGVPL